VKAVPLHNFLGSFAENNSDILFFLAQMETKSVEKKLSQIPIDRPIYISGLARSGTTILLELIARHQEAASYRYMDFPFVMLPFWSGKFHQVAAKKNDGSVERSHADGLKVTAKSPEAMEEILWMHFFPNLHNSAKNNSLNRTQRSKSFDSCYSQTIKKLLLIRKASRYLAKNNYNITRLDYIHGLFPSARFILLFRDPVWHLASLIKQHRLLSEKETQDKHVLAYMKRSGHFEFGLGLRPLNLTSTETTLEIQRLWDEGKDVEAWSKYWRDVYTYVASLLETNRQVRESSIVVNYETLCGNSEEVLARIYSHVQLEPGPDLLQEQAKQLHLPSYYKPSFTESELEIIKKETADVYRRMMNLTIV